MRHLALFLTLAFIASIQNGAAYDPNLNQKVKYNQSRAKWKIKENREKMKKQRAVRERERSNRYSSRSSSSSSSRSYASSRKKSSSSKSRASGSPTAALQSFISVANRATSLEQLYPYALKTKKDYWRRLNPKRKQQALMNLKKWTYHARVLGVSEQKPMVATIKLSGGARGVHMWAENGRWKFSDVIK